jgi:ABC-type transport system substrate-binding protein
VQIETKFPDPQLWDKVRPIYIMSEHWAEAHDARLPANVSAGEENYASRHANGTGPFILKEFEPNGRVVMVRNPEFWRAGYPAVMITDTAFYRYYAGGQSCTSRSRAQPFGRGSRASSRRHLVKPGESAHGTCA